MKSPTHIRFCRAALRLVLLAALAGVVLSCAGLRTALAASTPTNKDQKGSLPRSGRVAVRSGLEWLDETSPLFQRIRTEVEPLLASRGLTVMDVPPSTLSPLPPQLGGPAHGSKAAAKKPSSRGITLQDYTTAAGVGPVPKPRNTGQEYSTTDLYFIHSQTEGSPVMFRGGRIPGRLPPEVKLMDADHLDYVIICRAASVSPGYVSDGGDGGLSPLAGLENRPEIPAFNGNPDDFTTAAGPVQGVGTLGYGAPAPATPPPSSYGNTPGDYVRGYEGNSPIPGDPWHREADLKARDYQLKNSPPPVVATPPSTTGRATPPPEPIRPSLPKPPLPGDTDMPAVSPGPAPSRPPQPPSPSSSVKRSGSVGTTLFKGKKPAIAGYALEMECYDLKPVRSGKQPKEVWRCTVQQRADKPNLAAALPAMLRLALGR